MNFLELLRDNNVDFKQYGEDKHARQGWIQLECPFCGKGSGKYHLGYSFSGNYLNCWQCGGHSLASGIAEILDISFRKAGALLGGLEALRPAEERVKKHAELKLPCGVGRLQRPHKRYLRERGFDPKEISSIWKVQGIGVSSRLAWRLFIPIHYRHEVVSWTTRSISKEVELRYISASEKEERLDHKSLLYGEHLVKTSIVLVEGPTDVWAIGAGAVCCFGTAFKTAQIRRLAKYSNLGICFDAEKVAQRKAKQLAQDISAFGGNVTNIVLDGGKDPASAPKDEIQQLRNHFSL